MIREVDVKEITKAVKEMSIEANLKINQDVKASFEESLKAEESPLGREVLELLLENAKISDETDIPMCQDTGMVVAIVEVGQDVHFVGGDIEEAINRGIAEGYEAGYLRKSVVKDPFIRENTKDNTPGVIHYEIVPGDKVKITILPKGFGSENMGATKMLKPAQGAQGVIDFVVETVSKAGSNPCPPIVVGIGVGGTLDKAAFLSKKALLRNIGELSEKDHIKELEIEILKRVNNLGIGPQGLGGRTTAFDVHMEVYPTHIAGLPVAVNISCHALRRVTRII